MRSLRDHPLRYDLANELHARPFPMLKAPHRAGFVAFQHAMDQTQDSVIAANFSHLIALLDRFGASHPSPGATHYYGRIGKHALKWEQHTEFVTYTVFLKEPGCHAFDPDCFDALPQEWLARTPGQVITSILLHIEDCAQDAKIVQNLRDWFVPESLAVSRVLDGAATVAADFRIDPNGHQRIAVFADPATGGRRIGRIVQRLCEIETYKAMSMLGYHGAHGLAPQLDQLETRASQLIATMVDESSAPNESLHALLDVSAALEQLAAQQAYRFAATGAYEAILNQRIEVLREDRFLGRQSFGEFMMRRYAPAMRTVGSVQKRLDTLSARLMRASTLLRTRVDVAHSAHQQALLQSMDRRADQQLHLQRTVEGLSVVAISYYAVSLLAYLCAPFAPLIGLGKPMLIALLTPVVLIGVWAILRNVQKRI